MAYILQKVSKGLPSELFFLNFSAVNLNGGNRERGERERECVCVCVCVCVWKRERESLKLTIYPLFHSLNKNLSDLGFILL